MEIVLDRVVRSEDYRWCKVEIQLLVDELDFELHITKADSVHYVDVLYHGLNRAVWCNDERIPIDVFHDIITKCLQIAISWITEDLVVDNSEVMKALEAEMKWLFEYEGIPSWWTRG